MQFNGESNEQDLVNQTLFHSGANISNYTLKAITRNINAAYHRVAARIATADGTWKWDDANNTTLPIGTTNLVSGQKDYSLSDGMLELERVELQDASGNWHKLTPIDQSLITEALDEYLSITGKPLQYDKVGRSIFLYPTPNYSVTAGLKVHFSRSASIFTTSDTTKEPGFSSAFHEILPIMAAKAWAKIYKPELVNGLILEEDRMMADIESFYGRRDRDLPNRLQAAYHNNR